MNDIRNTLVNEKAKRNVSDFTQLTSCPILRYSSDDGKGERRYMNKAPGNRTYLAKDAYLKWKKRVAKADLRMMAREISATKHIVFVHGLDGDAETTWQPSTQEKFFGLRGYVKI